VGHWQSPHADEPLSRERRREIFALFLRYLAIFDYRVHVDRGDDREGARS
jgi:hypothetical protein